MYTRSSRCAVCSVQSTRIPHRQLVVLLLLHPLWAFNCACGITHVLRLAVQKASAVACSTGLVEWLHCPTRVLFALQLACCLLLTTLLSF